jgi:hypothetical protein
VNKFGIVRMLEAISKRYFKTKAKKIFLARGWFEKQAFPDIESERL